MKIDINAPIIPGNSAAGFLLGEDGNEFLTNRNKIVKFDDYCFRVDLPSVQLWIQQGIITQVGAIEGYSGKLEKEIGIGSTLESLANHYSANVEEDEEDNIVVNGLNGVCFESTEWASHVPDLSARIIGIYVHPKRRS